MLREASAKQGAAETANMLPPDVASKLNSRAVPHKAFCEQLLGGRCGLGELAGRLHLGRAFGIRWQNTTLSDPR
jgi:hypothetical protein